MNTGPDQVDRAGRTKLHYVATDLPVEERVATIRRLVAEGYDVNVRDSQGFTPLHFAVQSHDADAAATLIELGAEIDPQDAFGNSPLWRACMESRGRGELIQLLLRAGADPDLPNRNGKSPRDVASVIANYDVIRWFDPPE
ncbi:MAG: ankyrin repeat domain-containing protein [Planctomycetota bacterium]